MLTRDHTGGQYQMQAAVVVPCLDEEATLAETCRSLGFGGSDIAPPDRTKLLLVDNGSTDQTRMLMGMIAERSPPGAVHIFEESERGFVPPRHRGAVEARMLASREGWTESDVALVQADADTIYLDSYVDRMRQALREAGPGTLAEADTEPPPDFSADHLGYIALSNAVDASVASLNVTEAEEVVVDDKAAALLLSDYFLWGGHKREYTTAGDEIYAETTRLFIRGKAKGARKRHVGGAVADPSRRKLIANPCLYFATSGFPRERSWTAAWQRRYRGANKIEAFEGTQDHPEIAEAIWTRQAHSILLFAVLPRVVARIIGGSHIGFANGSALQALCDLVSASTEDLDYPGRLLMRCLWLMDDKPEMVQRAIEQAS